MEYGYRRVSFLSILSVLKEKKPGDWLLSYSLGEIMRLHCLGIYFLHVQQIATSLFIYGATAPLTYPRLCSPMCLGRWRQNGSLSIPGLLSQNFAILIWMVFLKQNWLKSKLNVAVNEYELELSIPSTGSTQPPSLPAIWSHFCRTSPSQFHTG